MAQMISFLYFVYFFATAAVLMCISCVLLLPTLILDPNRRILHYLASAWGYHFVLLNPGWRCRFQGKEHFQKDHTYVVVANHQSIADTFILSGLLKPYKWVSKASLFKIPFFGWNMFFTKYIAIKRGDVASIKNMMSECKQWLRRGESILMFPEGTRSDTGELSGFRDGSFKLAADLGVPVLPVVIDGTKEILPKHGRKLQLAGDIVVKLLPPVFPGDFEYSHTNLRNYVHELMKTTLAEMRAGEV